MSTQKGIRHRYISFAGGPYRRYIQKERQLAEIPKNGNSVSGTPVHGTYGHLLFDVRWREKRSVILQRDGYACQVCGIRDALQIHHRQYHYSRKDKKFKDPWEYENRLLVTLCESCHKKGHNKYTVPIVNI